MSGQSPIYQNISKKRYLEDILLRLDAEYIRILEMVTEYNHTHDRGIGFWSLLRIIFPVIETVASVIKKPKEDFLKEDLNVPYGHLVWDIYRNSLMHGDEMRLAYYKNEIINWATHIEAEGLNHCVKDKTNSHPTTIHIKISCLYNNLREFLVKEIAKNDTTEIQIQVGVDYQNHQTRVIEELEDLIKNH